MKKFKKLSVLPVLIFLATLNVFNAKTCEKQIDWNNSIKTSYNLSLADIKLFIKDLVLKRHPNTTDFSITKITVLANNKKAGKWTKVAYITDRNVQGNLVIIENGILEVSKAQKVANDTNLQFTALPNNWLKLTIKDRVTIYCTGDCDCSISGTFPPPQGQCGCNRCTLHITEDSSKY